MTIGIAASGARAGAAILRALKAAETVGSGAVGGFVSFVAITAEGSLVRADTQTGGTSALFGPEGPPQAVLSATRAGLMSSGPNRPEPLAQFTPADPAVGIVTGHRMPNTIGAAGVNVNDEVLALMRAGATPQMAVERVVAANPGVDAGLIALAQDGAIYAADTNLVGRLPDAGAATLTVPGHGAVSVLHNAIRPYRSLALLVAETALEILVPPAVADAELTLRSGVPLLADVRDGLLVDANLAVVGVLVRNRRFVEGRWSLGLGAHADVIRDGTIVAHATLEPYLVVDGGRVRSIDGQSSFTMPIEMVRVDGH